MKKHNYHYFKVLLLGLLFFQNITLYAILKNEYNWGARPFALGGTFIGIANDINTTAYNPAGLALLKEKQVMYMYARALTGLEEVNLNHNYASVALPFKKIFALAISWQDLNLTELYNEDTLIFTSAVSVNELFLNAGNPLIYFGMNIKYMYYSYTLDKRTFDDSVFAEGNDNTNIAADTGLYLKSFTSLFPNLAIGLVINNINQPKVGFIEKETVYREYAIGLSTHPVKKFFLAGFDLKYKNEELTYHTGLELYFIHHLLVPRIGFNDNEIAAGLGIIIPTIFHFNFDYGFSYPYSIEGTYGSHKISLIIKI